MDRIEDYGDRSGASESERFRRSRRYRQESERQLSDMMNYHAHPSPSRRSTAKYVAPDIIESVDLSDLTAEGGRDALTDRQMAFLAPQPKAGVKIYASGDLDLIGRPSVAIVGTRNVSDAGRLRTAKLARELAKGRVVVVSGLAKGVDAAAHEAAIDSDGRTIAVIGTPLDQAYPAENSRLQERIYRDHLLLSPFAIGERVFRSNFPKRNRVMAAISDATVIVEASDTSGTLHQAAECQRLGRWLFIMRAVAEDPRLSWPSRFLGQNRVAVLTTTEDIISRIT